MVPIVMKEEMYPSLLQYVLGEKIGNLDFILFYCALTLEFLSITLKR